MVIIPYLNSNKTYFFFKNKSLFLERFTVVIITQHFTSNFLLHAIRLKTPQHSKMICCTEGKLIN